VHRTGDGTLMKVYAALRDDVSEGYVWLKRPDLPARSVVRVTNTLNGRSLYCEALQIEDNFLAEYNRVRRLSIDNPDASIVMSYWYRARLEGSIPRPTMPWSSELPHPSGVHSWLVCTSLKPSFEWPSVLAYGVSSSGSSA
jgi:hypothetical protein